VKTSSTKITRSPFKRPPGRNGKRAAHIRRPLLRVSKVWVAVGMTRRSSFSFIGICRVTLKRARDVRPG